MQHPPFHRRHAFTLIEILVTIGILLILMGIVLAAVSHVSKSAKSNATHLAMANLAAMTGELDAQTRLQQAPSAWCWWDGGIIDTTVPAIQTANVNFWTAPYRYGGSAAAQAEPLDAPGFISSESGNVAARNGSPAIVNTMLAMSQLARVGTNREAIGKLPQNITFLPSWTGGSFAGPGTDGVLGTSDDSNSTVKYVAGCHVQHIPASPANSPPHFYVSTGMPATAATTATPDRVQDPDGTWRDETASARNTPLILDGWNNPIIFVPASGLNVLLLKSHNSYVDPGTNHAYTDQPQVIVSPDHRPFWASAGPDGDFSKGDDNIYSFEQ